MFAVINWIIWFFIAKAWSKDHGCFFFVCVWVGGVWVTSFIGALFLVLIGMA